MRRRVFFKHLVNSHMYDELMQVIPKQGEDGLTKCPFEDCAFESRSSDQRYMLEHYSIIHKIVNNKFDSMFPNHCYASKNNETRQIP